MTAVKFLLADLILLKGYIKAFIVFLGVVALFSLISNVQSAIGYMFFIVMIFAATPFSMETNEKSNRFYHTLPAKTGSMVSGRYLYLVLLFVVGLLLSLGLNIFFYYRGGLVDGTVATTYISALLCILLCLVQYPMYYKFGMEKSRITSMVLYLVPAMLVFSSPSLLADLQATGLSSFNPVTFVSSQGSVFVLAAIVFLLSLGWISHKISCAVCERKEI